MSVAYCILAHKNPVQLLRMIRAIYHPRDSFYIHIDRQAKSAFQQACSALSEMGGNVHFLKSERILWGGNRMSEVQVQSMTKALSEDAEWSHWINLSGQDFPMKTRSELVEFLDTRTEQNFITWFEPLKSDLWKDARERISRYHLESPCLNLFLSIPGLGRRLRALMGWENQIPYIPGLKRTWPKELVYYGGSNFVILNRDACRYLAVHDTAISLRKQMRGVAHADEIVFQTVLLNSPLKDSVVNENWREIHFDQHSPNPQLITIKDYERLIKSRAFFARKFDMTVDEKILTKLEERLAHE